METEYENIGYFSDTWEMVKKKAKKMYDDNKDQIKRKVKEILEDDEEKLRPSLSVNLGQPKVW